MEWHVVRWYGGTFSRNRAKLVEECTCVQEYNYRRCRKRTTKQWHHTRHKNCDRLQVVAGSVPPYHRTTVPPIFFNACTEARTPCHRQMGPRPCVARFPPPMSGPICPNLRSAGTRSLPPLAHPLCPAAFLILPDTSQPTPAVCSAQ